MFTDPARISKAADDAGQSIGIPGKGLLIRWLAGTFRLELVEQMDFANFFARMTV